MSAINPVHTPCKNCVFAKYENNTQTNCLLNYIDTYRNNNIEILEAYDEEKEFYIINSKKCIGYRENKWFNQFDMQDATIDEKILKYNELNKLHYLLVINLKNLKPEDLKHICSNLSKIKYQPLKIIFIRYPDKDQSFSYDTIMDIIKELNIKWRIQTIVDDSLCYNDIIHNVALINRSYRFILSLSESSDDLENIVNKANDIIHNQLKSFEIISNSNKTCFIFSGPVYRYAIKNEQNILLDDKMYEFYNTG